MVSTTPLDEVTEPAQGIPRGAMGPTLLGSEDPRMGPRQMILRSEFVRLLEQALESLGYPDLASRLEQESVGRWPAYFGEGLDDGGRCGWELWGRKRNWVRIAMEPMRRDDFSACAIISRVFKRRRGLAG